MTKRRRQDRMENFRQFCSRMARKREKRCYELAFCAMDGGEPPDGALLIHGHVRRPGPRQYSYLHAWILLPNEGQVYDPVFDRWFAADEYAQIYNASEHHRYTPKQISCFVVQTGHFGPWELPPTDWMLG